MIVVAGGCTVVFVSVQIVFLVGGASEGGFTGKHICCVWWIDEYLRIFSSGLFYVFYQY